MYIYIYKEKYVYQLSYNHSNTKSFRSINKVVSLRIESRIAPYNKSFRSTWF